MIITRESKKQKCEKKLRGARGVLDSGAPLVLFNIKQSNKGAALAVRSTSACGLCSFFVALLDVE